MGERRMPLIVREPSEEILSVLQGLGPRIEKESDLIVLNGVQSVVEVSEDSLKHLRETLLPRVFQLADDPTLVRHLLELENAELSVRQALAMHEKTANSEVVVVVSGRRFVSQLAETYAYLLKT